MILPFFGFEKNYEVQCQVQGLLVCSLQGRFEVICGKFKYLMCCLICTRPKIMSYNSLLKTGLNNVVLPTLFNVVNNIVQHCYT